MPARPKLAADTLGLTPTLDNWGDLHHVLVAHSVWSEKATMPFWQ